MGVVRGGESRETLLHKGVGETLLGVVRGVAKTINVMGDFVDENVVQKEAADGFQIGPAQVPILGVEEDASARIQSIAAERTSPGAGLVSRPGQDEDGAQAGEVWRWHAFQAQFDIEPGDRMPEARDGRQGDDAREGWRRGEAAVKALQRGTSLGDEGIVERPVRIFGAAVGVAAGAGGQANAGAGCFPSDARGGGLILRGARRWSHHGDGKSGV